MEKSKLGISIQLTGAIMYFLGVVTYIPALLLVGFVLINEDNEWLRKSALKMVFVVLSASIFRAGAGIIGDVFNVLDIAFGWIVSIDVPLQLDRIVIYLVSAAENLLLFILGFKALSLGTIKTNIFDKIITKHT